MDGERVGGVEEEEVGVGDVEEGADEVLAVGRSGSAGVCICEAVLGGSIAF